MPVSIAGDVQHKHEPGGFAGGGRLPAHPPASIASLHPIHAAP